MNTFTTRQAEPRARRRSSLGRSGDGTQRCSSIIYANVAERGRVVGGGGWGVGGPLQSIAQAESHNYSASVVAPQATPIHATMALESGCRICRKTAFICVVHETTSKLEVASEAVIWKVFL